MLDFELLKFMFEVLNVLLFALAKGALRGSILGAATLMRLSQGERGYPRLAILTMRIFETLSLSCCVLDRLLRRSSS